MSDRVLWVYAIARAEDASADGPRSAGLQAGWSPELRSGVAPSPEDESLHSRTAAGLTAVFHEVPAGDFTQDAIDARAGDLQWLAAIGTRHQDIVSRLFESQTIIPLRAFTLFSSADALDDYLTSASPSLSKILDRLDGRAEWTLRIELDPAQWAESLTRRVDSLRSLSEEVAGASGGRQYLLKKKLDEAKKTAARDAEERLLAEVAGFVERETGAPVVAETRQSRSGSFPLVNVLLPRSGNAIDELAARLDESYGNDGVTFAVTGPWPPYSFAGTKEES